MAGTLGATLDPVAGADNATINSDATGATKGGFTSLQGNFPEFIDLQSRAMGGARGMVWVNPTASARGFWDFPAQTSNVMAFRKYFSLSAAPAVNSPIDRLFPSSAHATANSCTLTLRTDLKLDVLEAGTTTLGTTTAALPTLAAAGATPALGHICLMGLIKGATGDAEAGKVYLRAYLRGSRTPIFDNVFTLTTPLLINSWRMGVDTVGTGISLAINDMTAWGFGDWLDRPDLVDMTFSPTLDPGGAKKYAGTQVLTVTDGYTSTGKQYSVLKAGAAWLGPQASNIFNLSAPEIDADVQPVVDLTT